MKETSNSEKRSLAIKHPETGERLECYGDIVPERGVEQQQRTHGPTAIETRDPASLDGRRFYCPECDCYFDEFMGVSIDDVA